MCSSLCERWQNDEILSDFSNYLFKQAIRVAVTSDWLPNFEYDQNELRVAATTRLSYLDWQLCVHTSDCVAGFPSAMELWRFIRSCEWALISRLRTSMYQSTLTVWSSSTVCVYTRPSWLKIMITIHFIFDSTVLGFSGWEEPYRTHSLLCCLNIGSKQ